MGAADVVILTATLTSIVMVVLLAVFVVKAVKHASFRWYWVAMAALLLLLWISGHWGFGGGIILTAGVFGYIFTLIGFYLIHILSTPLDIHWPIYVSLIIFVLMFAGVTNRFLIGTSR